jgi:hypothetical protein
MVQLKIILDTRKPKTNGTCPIYYRITQKKKVIYLYSGFSLIPTQWDENKINVKKSHPNAQTINISLTKNYFEIQKAIVELEDEELFSLDSLKDKLTLKQPTTSVKEFADVVIKQMFTSNRTGNAIVYQTGVNTLFKYKPSNGLRFKELLSDL